MASAKVAAKSSVLAASTGAIGSIAVTAYFVLA